MTDLTDRDLIRLHWPIDRRPAFDALIGIDQAFGEVVVSTSQPALGAIRLRWWQEALERLDHGAPPPEPRLLAVAAELLSRGLTGSQIAEIGDGWAALLDEEPNLDAYASRGERLFAIAARLLDGSDDSLKHAGRLYALADAARRGLAMPSKWPQLKGSRFPRALRPLTAFAKLAARDLRHGSPFEPEATPGRALALLSHRLFGTVA